jgi:hypothetical protein
MPRYVVVALLLATAACAPQTDRPEAPQPVYNPELGVRLAAVPDGFEVTANAGDRLELRPSSADPEQPAPPGRIWFVVGPDEAGVNLVAAVQEHQTAVESLPEGEYKGARELQGPLGTVFYSRGRYADEGGSVEETVLYALHPTESRRLEIHYRYPAGEDSGDRVTALIGLLSEVESGQPDQPAAPASGDGST